MNKLIHQVQVSEEDFTLNLTREIKSILDYFKVTIEGTQEKRTAKRLRLTNHFMRRFYRFIKMEKEYAFDIKTSTLSITQKEKYEL